MKKTERITSKKVVTPFEETYAEVLHRSFLPTTAYLGVLANPDVLPKTASSTALALLTAMPAPTLSATGMYL